MCPKFKIFFNKQRPYRKENTAFFVCFCVFMLFHQFSLTSIFTCTKAIFPVEVKQELHHQKRLLAPRKQLKSNYCTLGMLLRLAQQLRSRHPGSSKLCIIILQILFFFFTFSEALSTLKKKEKQNFHFQQKLNGKFNGTNVLQSKPSCTLTTTSSYS